MNNAGPLDFLAFLTFALFVSLSVQLTGIIVSLTKVILSKMAKQRYVLYQNTGMQIYCLCLTADIGLSYDVTVIQWITLCH